MSSVYVEIRKQQLYGPYGKKIPEYAHVRTYSYGNISNQFQTYDPARMPFGSYAREGVRSTLRSFRCRFLR